MSSTIRSLACGACLAFVPLAQAADAAKLSPPARFSTEVALQKSVTLRSLQGVSPRPLKQTPDAEGTIEIRPERGRRATLGSGSRGLDRPQTTLAAPTAAFTTPQASFDGLSNQDNFNLLGIRVIPPDPVGAVGPNHYVQMVNLSVAVFDKSGNRLMGPVTVGSLWNGYPVTNCAEDSGDPVVVYDQFADRWILSQFTASGPTYYNCIAVSQTSDPTGAYYLYAFSTGTWFPDYPKYGLWTDSYVITTREFDDVTGGSGIGVYALEKNKMLNGLAKARAVGFRLVGDDPDIMPLIGDGLLPAYVDGKQKPNPLKPIPIVGTQDGGASYGATFDALNIFELDVKWRARPTASLKLAAQLPVAPFDSIFPCAGRACLRQPGTAARLDILSYRQRPTWRLAYRNFKTHEAMVTAQSVEAAPGVAGMRWYELRRTANGYAIEQQGTYAPADGVHRWMGSVAMDARGNIAMGYSVVNGVDVKPGIRYTGRLRGDAAGQMTLGEGTIVNGTGIQRTVNPRWGDYTSLNLDPVDDCTFWYVNEYYTRAGELSAPAGWSTRIGSFKVPGCKAP